MENLNAIQLIALEKFKAPKGTRSEVEAGSYEVDFTVRFKGTVKVGTDGEKSSTVSLLSLKTVALILHYCGVTRGAAIKAITKAFNQVGSKEPVPTAMIELNDSVKALHDKIKKDFAESLPKTKTKGAVRTSLTVEAQ